MNSFIKNIAMATVVAVMTADVAVATTDGYPITRVRDTASKMSSSQSGINHRAIRTGRLIFKQMPFTAKERAARRIQAPRNRN